jgi:hypothetical protein
MGEDHGGQMFGRLIRADSEEPSGEPSGEDGGDGD